MQFVQLLRARHPRLDVRDLTPILDDLRSIKSPREIALVRRASQLAGLGMIEAIRSTEAGVYEYQLDAAMRYVFLLNGSRLDAYRSITASGTENINNGHYWRNTRRMEDGDLVLMDYAPDYRYYVSDIGRMWPVSGRYLPWQRELLQFILEYRNVVLKRIRPGVTADQVLRGSEGGDGAGARADEVLEAGLREGRAEDARNERWCALAPCRDGVHDVGTYKRGPLQPGHVFSVDPQMWVPEEHLYLRYEDTVVVTESGVENFTDFLPSELDDLETLVRERASCRRFPRRRSRGSRRSRRAWRPRRGALPERARSVRGRGRGLQGLGTTSALGRGRLVDDTGLHHEADALGGRDVLERVLRPPTRSATCPARRFRRDPTSRGSPR